MRKIILNTVFFAMLFLYSWSFRAMVLPIEIINKVTSEELAVRSSVDDNIFEYGILFHKGDVLNEIDDFEEYITENNSASNKDKESNGNAFILFNLPIVNSIVNPYYLRGYSLINFSRLPRYNYLSLRVLLI